MAKYLVLKWHINPLFVIDVYIVYESFLKIAQNSFQAI